MILSFIAFAGCNTPSLGFRSIEPVTLTVEGSTFDVRVNGTRAEAYGPIYNTRRAWGQWGTVHLSLLKMPVDAL